jgi:hypothetical protein
MYFRGEYTADGIVPFSPCSIPIFLHCSRLLRAASTPGRFVTDNVYVL